ncbi:MAG: hypothetical protein Q8O88_02470 [bacterium]|nr:hypothetical protein [bacterium]
METLSDIKTVEILKKNELSLFTTNDFARMFSIDNRNTLHKRLQRLAKRGTIKRLRQGKFSLVSNDIHNFEIANFIYKPSYISLESALSLYGIITGIAHITTSITVKRPLGLEIDNTSFSYTRISKKLYWGYQKIDNYLIAEPEKALLDWLYLGYKGLRNTKMDEIILSDLDKSKVLMYARKLNNDSFTKFIKHQIR